MVWLPAPASVKRDAESSGLGAEAPAKKLAKSPSAPGRGRPPAGVKFEDGKFVPDPKKEMEYNKKAETHTWDPSGGEGAREGMGDWVKKA